jgi:hypothetical protein
MTLAQVLQLEAVLLPILLPLLGLGVRWGWGKLPLPAQRRALLEQVVGQVVRMCEQVYPQLSGPEKRAEAVKLIEDELNRLGLRGVPPQTIDVLLEAAVASLPHTGS